LLPQHPVSGTRRGVYQIDSEGRGPTQRTLAMEREAHYDVADQPADFKRHPNVSYSTAFCLSHNVVSSTHRHEWG
jgi:hypothetical protein